MSVLVVLLGGAVGAVIRAQLAVALAGVRPGRLPVGIAVANLTGAFALGLLTGTADRLPVLVVLGVGTGLLGALTTYSTWAVDTVVLWRSGGRRVAVLNSVGGLLIGILLAGAGLWIGHRL